MALNGHQTWTMLEENCKHLEFSSVLMTIFSEVQENGVWRLTLNHELAVLYYEPSIHKVAKAGRK